MYVCVCVGGGGGAGAGGASTQVMCRNTKLGVRMIKVKYPNT